MNTVKKCFFFNIELEFIFSFSVYLLTISKSKAFILIFFIIDTLSG